ncbi:ABC transporter ATP-binding protein [Roseospira marina]|uniref:ABC transporter ATP-binding protein n=1 Tax=Roseospira marina TaxID=140057 RepID=A0A5M6I7V6_9PROT|nr:ABC transporter ATP-binding protein [Roseospira marina]KAA5604222.1 ABC transporter ATP-binding protein [Roseospira marina]MBB4315634.1 ATP-binding cassette subfamily B protein [Roseospira marina]MBB5088630.1 ATP-binding cassette subfamily B protein [Roseospira marina]
MSHATHTIPTLRETYRRMLMAAGSEAPAVRRMLALFALGAVAQGLAFACFFPLLRALLAEPADLTQAWIWLGVMVAATVADLILGWLGHGFEYGGAIADVTHDLRRRLGRQLRQMPMQALARWRTGDLGAVLGGSIDEAVAPMGTLSHVIIRMLVVPLVVIAVTLAIDARMALAMAVIVPMAVPIYRWQRRASGQERRDVAEAHGRTESDIVEYTQGLAVLRTLGQTGAKAQRLQESLAHLREVQAKALMAGLWPALLMAGLVEIGLLVVLALGGTWVTQGTLSLAAFAAMLVIVMRFSEPLALFSELTKVFDLMEVALQRMDQVLAVAPLPVTAPAQPPSDHDIAFDGVTFAYEGENAPALKDVSFHLPARSLTALVGPSGSGKTTVTRLIMRFADPRAGTVRIGGADIRSLSSDALAARLSVVFQDVYLFDDTILENIRMGRPDADDAAVVAAAQAANCHDFIRRLPDGYATRVGDIGGSLSGGERQRISIARAILKDAPIVILDEPTAALDTESERAVQKAIDALVRERTVLVIAHRLSTVVGADRILVFDDGRLVEMADHRSLLEAGGRYAALWTAQLRSKAWHAAPVPADV